MACTGTSSAAVFQWDADPDTAGAQDGGGTWNITNSNWIDATNKAWTNGNDAAFGAGTDGNFDVELDFSPNANSLVFNNSGYTLSAGSAQTLTLGSTSAVVLAAGKSASIGENLTVVTPVGSTVSGAGILAIDSGGTLRGFGTTNSHILSINSATVEVNSGGLLSTTSLGTTANGTALFINGTVNVAGGTVSVTGTLGMGQTTTAGKLTIGEGNVMANSTNGIRFGGGTTNAGGGTINLNGGTLTAYTLFKGTNAGTSVVNFNGGTLKATAAITGATASHGTFMNGLSRANVRDGGAAIDSAGFGITIGQALLHSNIPGDLPADGGLVKNGLGTLTLNGANTYNGGTTINAGALQFGTGAVPAAGMITINSGGSLNISGAFDSAASALSSGKLSIGSSGALALTGASAEDIDFGGFGNLMLGSSLNSAYTGTLTPADNTYRLGGGGAVLTMSNADALTGTNSLVIGAADSTGTVLLAADNNFSGSTTINSGTLRLNGSISDSSEIINNAALVFEIPGGVSHAYGQSISGSGTLTKTGTGTLVLSGSNTYSGATTFNNGYLLASSSGAFGTSAVTVNGGGGIPTTQLQLSGDITIANAIRVNSAGLSQDGVLKNLSGYNTIADFGFSGTTGTRINVVDGSSLNLPNDFAAGNNSAVRILGGGTLEIGGNNTGPLTGVFLGEGTSAGPTIKAGNNAALGAGLVTFEPNSASTIQSNDSTARTLANALAFNGTTATLGADSTGNLTFSGGVTLGENLDLVINNSETRLTGAIGEAGGARSLTKLGSGTLVIDGASSSTGTITVSEGTLLVNGSVNGAASVTVGDLATLGGSGSILSAGGITVGAQGIISPGNSIGTLQIDGSATSDPVLSLAGGASFFMELDGSFQSDAIQLLNGAAGDIVFAGNIINFSDLTLGSLAFGKYTLFAASLSSAYSGLTLDGNNTITDGLFIGSGLESYSGSTLDLEGNNIVLNVIPEPGSILLFGLGLGGMLGRRRRA